jgi:colanic acid biosynthesis glycosyl transferase WcaI
LIVSRILLLSLNYAPEPTGFAPHTTALAQHLQARGHDVTVLTGFPFAPRWARYPDYRGSVVRRETIDGVRVVRLTHFIPTTPGRLVDRLLMEGTFVASGALFLLSSLSGARYDVVMYVGAQPAIAWLGRIVAAYSSVPFIVKITDLAAQAGLDVGIVRSRRLGDILDRFEFGVYRSARAAIVLCDAFRDSLVNRGFPRDAVHVIRDSVDLETLHPLASGQGFRDRHGIRPDEFVVLYSGSFGLKQGLFDAVDAARSIDAAANVRWVLVGEGETRHALEERLAAAALGDRVMLLPLQPESQMNEMFAAADVLLLSQLRTVKDTVIPSKLLTYMAAGRPILAAVNAGSQAAAIIRDAQCGLLVEPESAAALAGGVRALMSNARVRADMARRGRAYAEQHFDRSSILDAQLRVIDDLLERRYPRVDARLEQRNTRVS